MTTPSIRSRRLCAQTDDSTERIAQDPTWLTDQRINDIKTGAEATNEEVLALAGEVRVRRRAMQAESWPDRPPLL